MYSDWPQFESFCERISVTSTNLPSLVEVLHQFQCYLETLLGQVRMRAVLAEQTPFSNEASTVFDLADDRGEVLSSSAEESPWAPLAVAV